LENRQKFTLSPIEEQIAILCEAWPHLVPDRKIAILEKQHRLPFSPNLPQLLAFPRESAICSGSYTDLLMKELFFIIKRKFNGMFFNAVGEKGKIEWVEHDKRTTEMLRKLRRHQKGDILTVLIQLRSRHNRCSSRVAQSNLADNEFGLNSFMAGCLLLTNPGCLNSSGDTPIGCLGDWARWMPRDLFGDEVPFALTPNYKKGSITGRLEFHMRGYPNGGNISFPSAFLTEPN